MVVSHHRLDFNRPEEPHFFVLYGWDAPLGYRAELRTPEESHPIAEYGALWADYSHDAPLIGLLQCLVVVGALDATGLDEALAAWTSPEPGRLSRDAKRAQRVIETLNAHADW